MDGQYEAPANVFRCSVEQPVWRGGPLPASSLTGMQINAGRGRFSKRRFDRSAEEESKKHYMINEVVPSAVSSVNDIPSAGGDFVELKNLP